MSDTTDDNPRIRLQELLLEVQDVDEQLPEPWSLGRSASELQRTVEALERIET